MPSRNNLALLADLPKVVLLRETPGIIDAYRRGQKTGVYPQKTDVFTGCTTVASWLARARELGLEAEFETYREHWMAAPGDQMILHYEELVHDPAKQIAQIERYLGLQPSGVTTLLRRKYTRLGSNSLEHHRATSEAWKTTGRRKT